MKNLLAIIILLCGPGTPALFSQPQTANEIIPPSSLQALSYRMIGPYRGGRVTTVTGIPSQPHTFFMGSTGGGVWKTTDGGNNWRNISDKDIKVGSIGAIEVAPSDPNIIYVGTGSASPRGNISTGKGMYKSTNGGKNWQFIGLPKAGLISKIQIHPSNPNHLYVAVLGNIFGPNPERGIYRTFDGGKKWEKVLFLSSKTGASDLVMDPNNPLVLFAGFWRVERKPWTLIDGDAEGGVFKTEDGGETWEKLKGGLPDVVAGRIGIAVSPANSQRVWVIREALKEQQGGLFRSENGGETWKRVNRNHNLRQRAWYYSRVFADPQDEHTVYVLNTRFYKSVDGGRTFAKIPTPHGDNHGLWINPLQPQIMIESNDGGANISYNGGLTWSTQYNQPTAELYRLSVDTQFPYRVYGAQQDNTTITVPSNSPGGLSPQQHWYAIGGGESGHIAVDPRDPDVVYAGNYIGQIDRTDLSKGHSRNIVAYPQMHDGVAPRDIKYRFQWNAPIRISPHDPDRLYHCSQYVHTSTDGGQSWEVISPDLSTNKDEYQNLPGGPIQHDHTGVELYTTIFAFEESPHKAGELWAGTDDGRVHITHNAGKDWEEITPKHMPLEGTVNMIELSPHAEGRAFMAVYKYRENDANPYIFRTNSYGKSWELITTGDNGIPEGHFVRVVREDPDRKGLLYAGTEFGMYISFDDGKHWQRFQLNLPTTPITDMLVYRKDLVLATQGRSFWVLDDLSPLHSLETKKRKNPIQLFSPRDAYRTQLKRFRGGNAPKSAPSGAIIYYLLEEPLVGKELSLTISDASGKVVRSFSTHGNNKKGIEPLKPQKGLNRFVWDLKYEKPQLLKGSFMSLAYTGGASAPPGTYTLTLNMGDIVHEQQLQVKADPRWEVSTEDLKEQFRLTMEVKSKLNECHAAIKKLRYVRSQIQSLSAKAIQQGYDSAIDSMGKNIIQKLGSIEESLIQIRNESPQDPINYPPKLDDQLAFLYSTVNGQDARPTQGCYDRFDDLSKELSQHLRELDKIFQSDVESFSDFLDANNVPRVFMGNE